MPWTFDLMQLWAAPFMNKQDTATTAQGMPGTGPVTMLDRIMV